MRALFRFGFFAFMDFVSDFEYSELIEVLRVLDDVAMDSWKQRGAQQLLACRDRIEHANVIFEWESETPGFFFADERIVGNLGVALGGHHPPDAAQEFALGWIERGRARDKRWRGLDG